MFTETLLQRPAPSQAVISLPGLRDALGGGGCCALATADAVLQELVSWSATISASVDSATETANITFNPAIPDHREHVAEALRDLEFTMVDIVRLA